MTKTNKILLTLFAILLLITIGEIIFYFTSVAKKGKNTQLSNTTIGNQQANSPQTPTNTVQTPANQAVGENIITLLRQYKKASPTELTLVTTNRGSITKLSTTPSVVQNGPNPSELAEFYLVINTSIGEESFVFTKKDMDKVYITEGENKPTKLDDPKNLNVKVGDTVTIQYSYNLKEQDPKNNGYLSRVEIIKQ